MAVYGKLGKKPDKKLPGMKKQLGKGATAKAKSETTKYRSVKKPKKSKAMYA